MTEINFKTMRVGDIVSHNFLSAKIFKKAGIDYYCEGFETLEEACSGKKINIEAIEKELAELENTPIDPAHNFTQFTLDVLCDYIVENHHKTAMKLLPQLTLYTQKIADDHGNKNPELIEIATLLTKVDRELRIHMANEEEVLFPAIKEVLRTNSLNSKFVTLREMMIMKTEHEYAGSVLNVIKDLTMNYSVPPDGCSTWQLTYKLLEQFEDDLQIHVHIENNILYPKALELAK